MARLGIEGSVEKKVEQLREAEKQKREELAQIIRDLRRYETALESLRGKIPTVPRKRRAKHELQGEQVEPRE